MLFRKAWFVLLPLVLAGSGVQGAEDEWQPEPLPRDQEIVEALAACPASIRKGAGVYVLTSAGFELERESINGFHSVIQRSQPGAFEPQCLDAEGSATTLEVILLRTRLRMGGAGQDEIDRDVGQAWAQGELSAPRRPGINYMLSEHNKVPVGADTVIPYQPHVMFYAPYLSNADLGAEPIGSAPVFVVNEGRPNAYAIVPVKEETEVDQESRESRIEYIEFNTTDMAATKLFYSTVFGWRFTDYGPDYTSFEDGRLDGGFAAADAVETGGPLVVVYAADLPAVETRVKENGGSIVTAIFSFPGGKRFHFADPSGNVLAVWSE